MKSSLSSLSSVLSGVIRPLGPLSPHLFVMMFIVGLLMMPDIAAASAGTSSGPSFSLDKILPSSLTGKPFLEQVVTVIVMVVLSATFIILGFGVMGGVADVFSSMTEARRLGDWGGFMKTLAMVIGVVIVGVVLAVLVYTWLTTISINPTVTIGGSSGG